MAPVRLLARLVVRCRRRVGVAVGVLVALFLLSGVLWVGLDRVFLRFTVWVVWFIVGNFVVVHGVCSCGTSFDFLFVCIMILIRRCRVWSFFFVSPFIVHVLEAWRRPHNTTSAAAVRSNKQYDSSGEPATGEATPMTHKNFEKGKKKVYEPRGPATNSATRHASRA